MEALKFITALSLVRSVTEIAAEGGRRAGLWKVTWAGKKELARKLDLAVYI